MVNSVLLDTAEESSLVIFKFDPIWFEPLENFLRGTGFSGIELATLEGVDLSPQTDKFSDHSHREIFPRVARELILEKSEKGVVRLVLSVVI